MLIFLENIKVLCDVIVVKFLFEKKLKENI